MRTAGRALRLLLGAGLLLALIGYLGPRAAVQELARLQPLWLLVATGCIALGAVLAGLNVYLLLSRDRALPLRSFLGLYWLAWALSLVVPGQVGDLAGLAVLLRRRGFEWTTSLGRGLLDKALSLSLTIALALAGLPLLAAGGLALVPPAWGWLLLVGLIPAGVLVVTRLFPRAAHRVLRLLAGAGREMLQTARRHPGRVLANLAVTAVRLLLFGTAYWAVFRGLGCGELALLPVLPLMALSSLVAYLPLSVNGLGTVEAAGVWLFGALGIPAITVLTAYLVLRTLVFLLAWGPAGLVLLRERQRADQPLAQG